MQRAHVPLNKGHGHRLAEGYGELDLQAAAQILRALKKT
jgi:hypothetical protein